MREALGRQEIRHYIVPETVFKVRSVGPKEAGRQFLLSSSSTNTQRPQTTDILLDGSSGLYSLGEPSLVKLSLLMATNLDNTILMFHYDVVCIHRAAD